MQKSKYLHLAFEFTHPWAEVLSYLPQTDIDIGPYAGLLIQLTLGKVLQQLIVQDRVTQLGGKQNHRLKGGTERRDMIKLRSQEGKKLRSVTIEYLYSLFSDQRHCVTKAIGNLREDLIADGGLLKMAYEVLHLKINVEMNVAYGLKLAQYY